MPDIYIPSEKSQEYLNGLVQGFCLDIDDTNGIAICVKFEASIFASIINGCPISFVIRNPHIQKRSCTLYVHDIESNPFFVTWKNFGEVDTILKDFDQAVVMLAGAKKVTLALFNEFAHCIFKTDLSIDTKKDKFDSWLFNVYNSDEYKELFTPDYEGNYFPENEKKGYVIHLDNFDHSQEEKIEVFALEYDEEWRESKGFKNAMFNYNNFQSDGKHGDYQEFSITNNLGRFLTPNEDFFIAPLNDDGTEFTDYVLINENACILIESKFIISQERRPKHNAISKAVFQLLRAESAILNNNYKLVDKSLHSKLDSVDVVIRLCLLNDRIILDDNNCRGIISKYPKTDLPIFLSVTTFFDFLTKLKLRSEARLRRNLVGNLKRFHDEYIDDSSQKICYIRILKFKGD